MPQHVSGDDSQKTRSDPARATVKLAQTACLRRPPPCPLKERKRDLVAAAQYVSGLICIRVEGQAPRVDGFGREFASERAQCLRTGRYQILPPAPPVLAEISPAIASSLATMSV